jgi:dihydroorotase/N-acyl-D-amino-acid deacylase
VVDGTGAPGRRADVAIRGDRIVAVAPGLKGPAVRTLDVPGLVIAPGFIDVHVHARATLFRVPAAENVIRQGVTTIVEGPDGGSPVPLGPFLDRVAASPASVNVGSFLGQGSVRESVMGTVDRAATPGELARMEQLVREGMEDGAFGLSTGLFYVPGAFTPPEEVARLARVAARRGGTYASHMRNEASGVVESVKETISLGSSASIPVQISHHKALGRANWGKTVETLRLVAEARARGQDVTLDVYPYTASKTGLSALLPAWGREGGRAEMLKRLADPATRARLRTAAASSITNDRGAGNPKNVVISSSAGRPDTVGKDLAVLTRARGAAPTAENAAETAFLVLEAGDATAIYHAIAEGDIARVMKDPGTMIASDGELPVFGDAAPHPRSYGTFARVLAVYVRQKGLLSLEEAVRKMSGLPAKRLGLADRGLVKEGFAADLAVFDPKAVVDRATFEKPHAYATGVSYVVVNGALVLDAGKMTTARPGRALRGPGYRTVLIAPDVASLSPVAVAPAFAPDGAFKAEIRPILVAHCAPCHEPGGKLYAKLPFDDPATLSSHVSGVKKRLKGDDLKAFERWIAMGPGNP